MKNTISEMKNTVQDIKIRLDEAEDRISELEDKVEKKFAEQRNDKRFKKKSVHRLEELTSSKCPYYTKHFMD